jgi:accessory gene regulator B
MKIFSLLSNKITDFLYKKEVISQEQKEVYIYGFTVLFLNILDILIILALGILIERYLDTIVFLMVFGITRQYTGGYHAKTVSKCLVVYMLIYLVIMFLSSSNVILVNGAMFQILLCIVYIIAVIIYAPIQNDNKVISNVERKKYKIISIVSAICISTISIIVYGIFPTMASTISLTLFAVTILMILVVIRK